MVARRSPAATISPWSTAAGPGSVALPIEGGAVRAAVAQGFGRGHLRRHRPARMRRGRVEIATGPWGCVGGRPRLEGTAVSDETVAAGCPRDYPVVPIALSLRLARDHSVCSALPSPWALARSAWRAAPAADRAVGNGWKVVHRDGLDLTVGRPRGGSSGVDAEPVDNLRRVGFRGTDRVVAETAVVGNGTTGWHSGSHRRGSDPSSTPRSPPQQGCTARTDRSTRAARQRGHCSPEVLLGSITSRGRAT
jgi:hypothetical protein